MTDYQIALEDFAWLLGRSENHVRLSTGNYSSIVVRSGRIIAYRQYDGVEDLYFATQTGYDRLHACTA